MIGRIRTVKPEFFQHYNLWLMESLSALPMRVGFEALWSLSDREGRFEWKPQTLKLNGLPYDSIDPARVLDVLFEAGYVGKYLSADRSRVYGFVVRWHQHQQINARETASRLPPPPADAERAALNRHTVSDLDMVGVLSRAGLLAGQQKTLSTNATSESAQVVEVPESADASATRAPLVPDLCSLPFPSVPLVSGDEQIETEHLGDMSQLDRANGDLTGPELPVASEGVGELSVAPAAKSAALPAIRGARTHDAIMARLASVSAEIAAGQRRALALDQMRRLAAELVFSYWTVRFEHPKARLDDKREARIMERLRENDDDVSELLYALDGAFHDDRIMAKGKFAGDTMYDGIETVLRDRAQVERFSSTRVGFKQGRPHRAYEKYLAALRGEGGVIVQEVTPEGPSND
jgi:hypothetical protein